MSDDVWRPLGFEGDEAATYDALHDGVPPWMAESFWAWMRRQFVKWVRYDPYSTNGHHVFRPDLLLDVERVCRLRVGYTGDAAHEGVTKVRSALKQHGAEIRVADYLLSRGNATAPEDLNKLLHESGSKWQVTTRAGRPALGQRVPEGVQANADAVMGLLHG